MAPGMGMGGNERNVEKYAQTCPDYINLSKSLDESPSLSMPGNLVVKSNLWKLHSQKPALDDVLGFLRT